MKFEKIIIPPGWQESFTKYPNGRTIFEALSNTITTVNEGIEDVNQKVNQGLVAIEQAENTIRQEITESFNTLQLQLEGEIDDLSSDLIADFALLQSDVLNLIAGKANAADVYTKQQVDAQLAEKVQDFKIKNEVINSDFANSTTEWTQTSSGAPLIENGYIKMTASIADKAPGLGQQYAFVNGKKYYFRYISVLDKDSSPRAVFFGATTKQVVGSLVLANQESVFSGVYDAQENNTAFRFGRILSNDTERKMLKIKNTVIICRTDIFGAGNEPTKLEMDELMKVIPNGWWNGELSLTQKQFITWQLNLIRKNTNAIIALGGTIV